MIRIDRRWLFPDWPGCGDRRKKHLLKMHKNRDFWGKSAISSERLALAAMVRTHFCRAALGTLDGRSFVGLAKTGTEHLAFPRDSLFHFCYLLANLRYFSLRKSRFIAPTVEHEIVARDCRRAWRSFTGSYDKFWWKKNRFFQDQFQNLSIVSAIFGHKFQNDLHRGQPLSVLCPNESIWDVCRVFSFLAFPVEK